MTVEDRRVDLTITTAGELKPGTPFTFYGGEHELYQRARRWDPVHGPRSDADVPVVRVSDGQILFVVPDANVRAQNARVVIDNPADGPPPPPKVAVTEVPQPPSPEDRPWT